MVKQNFDLKNEYNKFVTELTKYHQNATGFNDPEEFVFQFDNRLKIIDSLSELCSIFVYNSHYVLEAFEKYKEYQHKHGVNINFYFFDNIISCFIKLVSEREEIYKWVTQLANDVKFLEENNVCDMSSENINNL